MVIFFFLLVVEVNNLSIFLERRIEMNLRNHLFFQATTIQCLLSQALSSHR